METTYLIYVIITLLFSAFFSGIEIAYISANKLQIELQSKQGALSGKVLSSFIKRPGQFIGTTLMGNTISLVLYGIFMAYLLEYPLDAWLPPGLNNEVVVLLLQTLISTIIVLITAEFLPKSLFMLNPNNMLSIFAIPFLGIYYLMYPVVWAVVGLSRFFITKILRLEYSEDRPVFTVTDLNSFIQNHMNQTKSEGKAEIDTKIFDNAVEFKTVRVRECMIPRTDIVSVEVEDSIEDLKEVFAESGHSKIIVYRETIDDVIGYCHQLELFKKPKTIEEILTPIIIAPESALANELLIQFIQERKSLALVVDEFGGTSGIVSMEDIIEEIFGEIEDEYDSDDLIEQKIGDQEYLLSARHEIDYLNDKYDWDLPIGDFETISGLILSHTENLPKKGESVTIEAYTFTVVSRQDHRIDSVRLKINGPTIF
ncbi:MAG TPA: hemolysin [Algoriphagus sp.]|jgi:putative hemolysin|uniref:hemolysin family protein n=1 Tax=unclassified Algoriphagus TaxID=2641541 RepID=UPI000C68FE2D|nr:MULTISPECIES: hemolysin family protein [unclassified Algoriphagus]MAL15427.1 hemolysin [Algoriphagus sp.]MAN86818.1 hemolysin [Algoriphagus sp.]QYH40373.1 HlyC/CorC family transporter [Algoriphagus sp. NBT04N3]HAS59573.1 hemolysin [Algoriphagus sp.]HCB45630.1 hemolysin [Algoriphagus sp.]|tara:strand:+ start:19788 stop:21068 length:1281 start_codon:yes stop_codon:yes gene_type:complete